MSGECECAFEEVLEIYINENNVKYYFNKEEVSVKYLSGKEFNKVIIKETISKEKALTELTDQEQELDRGYGK